MNSGFKINIGLHITERMSNGFHRIESIFYPVDLIEDSVKITPQAGETTLEVVGADFTCEMEKNLCVKAYRLLEKDFGIGGVHIHLEKKIPSGAGVGGGSGDAATTLILLNQIFNLALSQHQLKHYAAQIGSDIPFFIDRLPSYVTGRGEIIEPIGLDLSHTEIKLKFPGINIGTKEAYSLITPKSNRIDLREAIQLPICEWKKYIVNDFEEPLFQKYPILGEIKENFYKEGAEYASLSGSGSAIFAIFKKNRL